MRKIREAGADLGLKNFALSIVQRNGRQYKVLHAKMIRNLVTSLKENVLEQRLAFYREVRAVLVKYRPRELIAERFMTRGRFGQAIGECLSFMLGTLADLCHRLKIRFRPITAASWKNAFHRTLRKQLKSLYKYLKPLPPHIVDSVLQATYGINPTYSNWSVQYLKKVQLKWH